MALWSDPRLASPADLAACRALLREGSRSFLAASRLLPSHIRDDAISLYAFCRVADDAIDMEGGGVGAVSGLQRRLTLVYQGTPAAISADRALADLVSLRCIPKVLLEALLEGFSWDAAGRRYDDLSSLMDYAVRVAGSVGVMMALLMGARAPCQLARACELGVAMQLSNIARDVGEDARAGRIYLPLNWLRDVTIDPEDWLKRPVFSTALGGVVQRLLAIAEDLYCRADSGISSLPSACRLGTRAARMLYAEIGHQVARQKYDSISERAFVPSSRKVAVLAKSFLNSANPKQQVTAAPIPEAASLLAAIEDIGSRVDRTDAPDLRLQGTRSRMERFIALLAKLERRQALEPVG